MSRLLVGLMLLTCVSSFADAQVNEMLCTRKETLVWRQNRVAVTTQEFMRIVGPNGTVTAPKCACIDARQACEAMRQDDCAAMMPECNRALNGGGQFCMRNRWGAQTCYAE
jgi:hypothetical protein